MLGWLAKKLQRMEMASDMLVLEKMPDSPQADKIREKYQMRKIERDVKSHVRSEIRAEAEIIEEAIKIGKEEGHKFRTLADQHAEAKRRIAASRT